MRRRTILPLPTLIFKKVMCLDKTEYGERGQLNFEASPGGPYLAMQSELLRKASARINGKIRSTTCTKKMEVV